MEFNFEDNFNKIFQGCWLLAGEDGEENGWAIGLWGWVNVVGDVSA